VINANIMWVFHDFHTSSKVEKRVFIGLIMKKYGAIDLKDFLHISLVSRFYKIIVKVLANRLRNVVKKITLKS
jgi:hypothetical protein